MKRLKLLLAGISFLSLILVPTLAAADVNDFTVTSFNADETLTRNDPQGELQIIERINVDFRDYNQGILRAIPDRYKGHYLQLKVNKVSSESGAPTDYTTYTSNGNTVLKIGDPDKTVTGAQAYTIDYMLRNVISFYKDHDELYWDINGDQWQQPFTQVSVTLHLPDDLKQAKQPICYAGGYGSTTSNCTISTNGDIVQSTTSQPLSAYQTLTYVASFDKGYFQPATWYETLLEYWRLIGGTLVPLLGIGGVSLGYWWRFGRDPRGRRVIIPEYAPPAEFTPLLAGEIIDFRVDSKDITATIIDLAVRKYLKIVESKERKLLKDKLTYQIVLVNADWKELDPYEVKLMMRLFPAPAKTGDTVDISAKSHKLYDLVSTLHTSIRQKLVDDGYIRSSGSSIKNIAKLVVWAIAVSIISYVLFGGYATIGVVSGVVIAGIAVSFMDARTATGVAAVESLKGLKLYMEVAEKDRIKKLQGPDAAYASDTAEPSKTVDLFEKLLPYAIVLGVEKQWAKQFESLYTTPPDWYSGNWTTFNAAYLASSLNSGVGGAVNGAFSAPSSSGSSGSGGGGFSGGGGGGGGGGGW